MTVIARIRRTLTRAVTTKLVLVAAIIMGAMVMVAMWVVLIVLVMVTVVVMAVQRLGFDVVLVVEVDVVGIVGDGLEVDFDRAEFGEGNCRF